MTHTEPVAIYKEMCSRRWPQDQKPIWPGLVVWTWVSINKHTKIFPSIEYPLNLDVRMMCLGQDFDGSIVFMVAEGPELGKTILQRFSPITLH